MYKKKAVSKNKYRHRWIDLGKEQGIGETYEYRCKHCGIYRVKLDFISFMHYEDKDFKKFISGNAPECKPH